jgi:hypothetical protein
MPNKKLHIGYARLNKKSLNNYLKGKSFMIKPVDQEDESNQVVKLQYKAKKNLTKLNKNLAMNKGVVVKPDELEDMEIHSGNGLFDSLKKISSNPIAKTVLKTAMPIASNLASQQVKNLTGSDALANASKNLMNQGTSELTSGSGFNFNDILKSKITKNIVKAAMPIASNQVSQQVKNLTGSNALAGVSKNLMNEGVREMTSGSGFKNKQGGSFAPLSGGSLTNPNQFLGISHNSPDFSNANQRMAYVRSHRRSNGVVM